MSGRGRRIAWAMAALAASLSWMADGGADEVHLRNGEVLEAIRVERKADKYVVVQEYMTIEVPVADVERVVTGTPVKPAEPAAPKRAAEPGPKPAARSGDRGGRCTPPPMPEYGRHWTQSDVVDLMDRYLATRDERYLEIREILDEGDPRGLVRLTAWSEGDEPDLRGAALRAMGHFDDRHTMAHLLRFVGMKEADRSVPAREGVRRWCARHREAPTPDLAMALKEQDIPRAARLLAIAAEFDYAWARPSAFHWVEWGGADLRRESVIAMRAARDAAARRHLPALLVDAEWSVRREAAFLCAELQAWESVTRLVDCLRDPEPKVVEAAHQSLRTLSGEEFPADERTWRAWWRERNGE